MRIAIVGSRCKFMQDPLKVAAEIRAFVASLPPDTVIVSGGEWTGVDGMAEKAADDLGYPKAIHPAKWRVNGALNMRAGFERNQVVVDDCDELHAWTTKPPTPGTADAIRRARRAKRPVTIHEINT